MIISCLFSPLEHPRAHFRVFFSWMVSCTLTSGCSGDQHPVNMHSASCLVLFMSHTCLAIVDCKLNSGFSSLTLTFLTQSSSQGTTRSPIHLHKQTLPVFLQSSHVALTFDNTQLHHLAIRFPKSEIAEPPFVSMLS